MKLLLKFSYMLNQFVITIQLNESFTELIEICIIFKTPLDICHYYSNLINKNCIKYK